MKVLIVRLSSLGDVIHTLPAVDLLKKNFSGCDLTWVVERNAANLLQGYPGIDRLIVSNRSLWFRNFRFSAIDSIFNDVRDLIRQLRTESYDIAIDFQGLLKSSVLIGIVRSRRKIGYQNSRELSSLFYTEKVPPSSFKDHAIKRHMGLLRYLGINDSPPVFNCFFSDDDEVRADGILDAVGLDAGCPIVVFHTSAVWPTKIWPIEKAAGLCDMLQNNIHCQVLLTGAMQEKINTDKIIRLTKTHVRNIAGMTTLKELSCIISRASLVVSMDSGPMHLACASGTPVVSIFGPTSPDRTGPFGPSDTVIRRELQCSPCYNRRKCPYGHHSCMRDIEVEDVYKVCSNYL